MSDVNNIDKREYFRSVGVVYLHIETLRDHFKEDLLQPKHKSKLDPVALKTMSLKARIQYNEPELKEYFLEIIDIIETLHEQLPKIVQNKEREDAQRQSVIISGSGMQFQYHKPLEIGEKLFLTITFPSYPNETIGVQGEVISCKAKGESEDEFRISVKFKNLSDANLQLIIQFGNKLQRQKLLEKKGH